MELKGAVALVTGGNGGLGQRICHALAEEGAHVAVMYARSRDQAEPQLDDVTTRTPRAAILSSQRGTGSDRRQPWLSPMVVGFSRGCGGSLGSRCWRRSMRPRF
jgi:NAD(P)-dependent dehydrogenase (short-subunit alcohol dehydrogenase family)